MNDRRALLTATLGFLHLERRQISGYATALHGRRALTALHAWLDTWRGIGLIVVGIERYGFRLSLPNGHYARTRHDRGSRAPAP